MTRDCYHCHGAGQYWSETLEQTRACFICFGKGRITGYPEPRCKLCDRAEPCEVHNGR